MALSNDLPKSHGPNLGANDGYLLQLTDSCYRDLSDSASS